MANGCPWSEWAANHQRKRIQAWHWLVDHALCLVACISSQGQPTGAPPSDLLVCCIITCLLVPGAHISTCPLQYFSCPSLAAHVPIGSHYRESTGAPTSGLLVQPARTSQDSHWSVPIGAQQTCLFQQVCQVMARRGPHHHPWLSRGRTTPHRSPSPSSPALAYCHSRSSFFRHGARGCIKQGLGGDSASPGTTQRPSTHRASGTAVPADPFPRLPISPSNHDVITSCFGVTG